MYVVSGSRHRMISEIDERGSWMSPSITHGDLAPDMMSSTKLNIVSVKRRKLCLAHTHIKMYTQTSLQDLKTHFDLSCWFLGHQTI